MRKRDSIDALFIILAICFDAMAIFGGFILATWLRFDSNWIPLRIPPPESYYQFYAIGAAFATVVFLIVQRTLGLFVRPQMGSFISKIPRIVRSVIIGIVLTMVLAFASQNELPQGLEFSRLVIFISFFTITILLLLERYILYRIEWNVSRHIKKRSYILILGTDSVAAHIKRVLCKEPMLRACIVGFLQKSNETKDSTISDNEIMGKIEDLKNILEKNNINQVIIATSNLPYETMVNILLLCERNLAQFMMVPDLFRILTVNMDVHSLDDIPLLCVRPWPLDYFGNRLIKRIEDIIGALVGLVLSIPVIFVAAVAIKMSSRGPVFYIQERYGEKGKIFRIYKLRTMLIDAEKNTGPVFAQKNDPRVTPIGALLRKYNIDELPQFWNVLKGDMSLVGPRPERPHFVEKFKEDIGRYMWRHMYKPGMTGWAQVNGLRGNTSIEERIKYDLYYLENWSLAFDFKILLKTLFARENAY